MHTEVVLLYIVIVTALVFDFINGFHDTANAIATVVSTRVLTPRAAVLMAAILNLLGAFLGLSVATTIATEFLSPAVVTQWIVLTALIGAIVWNLLTWYLGLPSSSSHALIGGLIGSAIASGNMHALNLDAIVHKALIPLVVSPLAGLVLGFGLMLAILWSCNHVPAPRANSLFRKLQLVSAAFMAYSHGNNDAQKSMGIITMALVSVHWVDSSGGKLAIPIWVICCCALSMAMGTMAGGWKIIRTMGSKIIKLQPVHGFAAETAAAIVILTASHFGAPVSTTHVISGSIMGVGATRRLSAVRWGVAGNMIVAWVLTIPAAALVAGLVCLTGMHHVGLAAAP